MESCLSSSYTKTSVTVCAQSGRRLHGHMRVVEHTPLSNCSRSMMFWSKQRHSSMRRCWSTLFTRR